MSDILLITDDPCRGARLARDLRNDRTCRVLDLYDCESEGPTTGVIVVDVAGLSTDSIRRLQQVLGRLRQKDTPLLFLLHGDGAKARMQAVALGATTTLSALAASRILIATVERIAGKGASSGRPAAKLAFAAQQFLSDVFVPNRPITTAMIDNGGGLIARALRETNVRDWVQEVRRFDDVLHQHCLLVAGLAASFAQSVGFTAADCHHLTRAALLHDVGKIHIPKEILNKPGPLTPAERAVVETHPARGHAMLADLGFSNDLLVVVRSHHEMLDGTGYPDKLRGAEIPDLVRLVTVCDIFGALIERRSYKEPMAAAAAYGILSDMRDRLDADLVRAFAQVATALDPATKLPAKINDGNKINPAVPEILGARGRTAA